MEIVEADVKQRYTQQYAAIRGTTIAGAPFIGPGDLRYDTFMGIQSGALGYTAQIGSNPLARIEIWKRAVWVYACSEARSVPLSKVPLKLYQKTPDNHHDEVTQHPILDVLTDINPKWDTASTIRYDTETSLCIHGRYHWLKVRNPAKVVKELYGLPVQYTQIIPSYERGQRIKEFRYQPQGQVREFYKPEDVVYFRYGTPEQNVEGQSPLEIAIETTRADISLQVAQNAMSSNAARPSMLVTVKPKWSEIDYRRMSEELNRKYAGAVNAGKIMLIDNADNVKVDKIQLTPAEMEWIKEHQSHAQDICVAFRVPPMIANDFSDASRLANAGAGHRFYWENTLLPELSRWEDVLNWQLLWTEDWGRGGHKDSKGAWYSWERFNGYYLQHDVSGIQALREDENARSTRARNAFGLGLSIDEIREIVGYDPADDPKIGSTIFIANNLVPIDSVLGTSPEEADVETQDSESSITETEALMYERGNKTGSSSLKTDLNDTNNLTRPPDKRPASGNVSGGGDQNNVRAELTRWKKVASKDLQRAMEFESAVIPLDRQRHIRAQLALSGTADFSLVPDQYVGVKKKVRPKWRRLRLNPPISTRLTSRSTET